MLPPNGISDKPVVVVLRGRSGPIPATAAAHKTSNRYARKGTILGRVAVRRAFGRANVPRLRGVPGPPRCGPARRRLEPPHTRRPCRRFRSKARRSAFSTAKRTARHRSEPTRPAGSPLLGWGGIQRGCISSRRPALKTISECEPLEPREEVLDQTAAARSWERSGQKESRTRSCATCRLSPTRSTSGVKAKFPEVPGASGVAGQWAVWVNGRHGWRPYLTTRTFLHELMHVYEFQLRLACWHENQEIDGWILHEDWLRAYEADRRLLEESGLPLREPDAMTR